MAYSSLYMLKIVTNVPALVMIDGVFAGKTDAQGFVLPVSQTQLAIVLYPLTQGAPISKIVNLEKRTMEVAQDRAALYLLPQQQVVLTAQFPEELPCGLPYVLKSLPFAIGNRQMRASIYFDRTFNLAVEEGDAVAFCCAFRAACSSCSLQMRHISGQPFLFAEGGQDERKELIALSLSPISFLFSKDILGFSFSEQGLRVECALEGLQGAALLEQYAMENAKLVLQSAKLIKKEGALSTAEALVYAIKYGDEPFAMSLLAPSLKQEVSFSDLKDFFGEFEALFLQAPHALALCYPLSPRVYDVRTFSLELQGPLISNIAET